MPSKPDNLCETLFSIPEGTNRPQYFLFYLFNLLFKHINVYNKKACNIQKKDISNKSPDI